MKIPLIIWTIIASSTLISAQAVIDLEGRLDLRHSIYDNSVVIGKDAGLNLDTMINSQNILIGRRTGINIKPSMTSGRRNSFLGDNAGDSNTTGSNNTFIGYQAGEDNSNGDNNTYLGYFAGLYLKGLSTNRNICIGTDSGPLSASNVSERLYIDVKASDFPLIYGEFDNDIVQINGHLNITKQFSFVNDTGDEATFNTDVSQSSSDFVFYSNDNFRIDLDNNNGAESGDFEIFDGADNRILLLEEDGDHFIDGTYNAGSDINRKEEIVDINYQDILSKLVNIPIKEWQYKGDDIRHVGPMAQDYYAAFGLGEGETTIATIDADGINMAAIQALDAQIKESQKLITAQQQIIDQLKGLVEYQATNLTEVLTKYSNLENRVAQLEKR